MREYYLIFQQKETITFQKYFPILKTCNVQDFIISFANFLICLLCNYSRYCIILGILKYQKSTFKKKMFNNCKIKNILN